MKKQIFIDSGAFSAYSQNAQINILEYIKWIKENQKFIEVYANLDVIGDAEKTLQNQHFMEQQGLTPLPCFHYGEDFSYLKHYIDNYNYLGLGGMVPISKIGLVNWLDKIFSNFICDKNGIPKVKVHGFGMTTISLILRYPWYSVDSSTWINAARFGYVYIPVFRKGEPVYDLPPIDVFFTLRTAVAKLKYYKHYPLLIQKNILSYISEKGFSIGKSNFKKEDRDKYELKENEKWTHNNAVPRMRNEVETIIERGLINDDKQRLALSAQYFLGLENSRPPWPWAFKRTTIKGWDILQ